MSIAEKLTTIAENQERVFEAGYEKGKSEGGNTQEAKELLSCGIMYNFQNYTGTNIDVESEYAVSYTIENTHNASGTQKGICANNKNVKECRIMFPNATIARYSFYYCSNLEHITVDMTNIVDGSGGYSGFNHTFGYCTALKRIDGQISMLNCNPENTFVNCKSLEYVAFVPSSIYKSLSLSYSPNLNEEGVQTLIDGLVDITDGVARTLTLHPTVKSNLTDEQILAITTEKGWTLA